jgi:DNA repair exonuclease SbcCD nuclease subunit
MVRFLHVADIHLGFDRYDCKERTRDFFESFRDVLERHAIREAVDFVVIAGDLFEHRIIQPSTLNQAQLCLQLLQDANIPAIAIEGNHDNRPYGTKTNWLRYLADWGLLLLLEPGNVSFGEPFYTHWNWETRRGGYIDLDCGARVLGSSWYGSAAPKAIEQIATAIQTLPPFSGSTILLFHHGLEGQIARYAGALRYPEVLPLKQAGVDYLALGHIHKSYEIDDWVFNPGSLEANSVEETSYTRGAYLVSIANHQIQAELQQDYQQRPIVRLTLMLRGHEQIEDVEQAAIATVQQAIYARNINPHQAPIVELKIEGQVGFNRLDLDTRSLQRTLQELSQALIFLLKYNVDEIEYASPLSNEESRHQIETEVFADLLSANAVYKSRSHELAHALRNLKDSQLEGQSDANLYQSIEWILTNRHQDSDRNL